MAHSLSAKKRIRQSIKRRARNRSRKDAIKSQIKSFNSVLHSGDFAKAELELRKVAQRLDKVAAKNTIHKNAASRKRSRLARRLNALKAAGKGAGTTKAAGTKAAKA